MLWRPTSAAAQRRPWRDVADRLAALGYGLSYDAVVRGFAPYQTLVSEVSRLVARSIPAGADPHTVNVLDISCGTGTVAAWLARDGYRVVGVDGVEHLVNVARRRYGAGSNPTFHHVDVALGDVPGAGTYDVVVSMHTLYWHPSPHAVLQACRRALKPGGHGVFLTYCAPAHVGSTFVKLRKRQGLGPALRALRWLVPTAAFEMLRRDEPHYLTQGQFARALAQAGFDVIDLQGMFLAEISLLAWTRGGEAAFEEPRTTNGVASNEQGR